MFTYQLLTLPQLPIELQTQLWDLVDKIDTLEHINKSYNGHTIDRELFNNGVSLGLSASFKRRRIPKVFEQWVKEHITKDFVDIGLTASEPGRSICGPHIDSSRCFTLLYVLRSGGPDSKTSFWIPKTATGKDTYCDYADLENLGSVHIPKGHWCIINSGMLHSVENINEGRITFQVSLKHNPFEA